MSRMGWSIVFAISMMVGATAQQTSQAQDAKAGDTANSQYLGNIERVTDVQGTDCTPYLAKVIQAIRSNWLPLIPPDAKAPEKKSGKGAIEFTIMPDGKLTGMKTISSTGDAAMDHAASAAITASQPFPALPAEFHTPSLTLRFRFYYNPRQGDLPDETKKPGS